MTLIAAIEPTPGDVGAALRSSNEVIALATALAEQLNDDVETVALPTDISAEACGMRLARLLMDERPNAVVTPATDFATEAMAHAAAVTNLPLACNCVSASADTDDDVWTVTRARGGGVLLEDAELTASTKLVTLAPGSVDGDTQRQPTPGPEGPRTTTLPKIRDLPEPDGLPTRTRSVERATTSGGGVSLATAPVVVSGGRGVGSAAGFGALEDLAGLLGGAVGCSRVVTNNGWRPHSDQVGQTGTKVSPDVYIAAGISGATQHWAGCMSAKTILAINTDAEAPMVARADYAVIGDAVDVVQAIADELRRRRPP